MYVPLLHALRPADRLLPCAVQLALLAACCAAGAATGRLLAAGLPLDRLRRLAPAAYLAIGGAVVPGVGVPGE